MGNEKTIQEQFKEEYKSLPLGYKKVASDINGCVPEYMRKIANGQAKKESIYHKAIRSVRLAKKKWKEDMLQKIESIDNIN